MQIIDVLREREKDLGKRYCDWNEYEKIKFILDYDIDEFHTDFTDILEKLNIKIEILNQNIETVNFNPKLERYVSIDNLLNFITYNYQNNLWNNGLSKLQHMFPTLPKEVTTYVGLEYFILRKIHLCKEEDHVTGKMMYAWIDKTQVKFQGSFAFKIVQKNGTFCFLCNEMNIQAQKDVSNQIDFSKLYDYCMNNEFASREYSLIGKYDWQGQTIDVPITISDLYLRIGYDENYVLTYHVNNGEMQEDILYNTRHHVEKSDDSERLNILYISDPDFVKSIKIRYEDLPTYVQNNIFNIPKQQQDIKKNKHLFRKLFIGDNEK